MGGIFTEDGTTWDVRWPPNSSESIPDLSCSVPYCVDSWFGRHLCNITIWLLWMPASFGSWTFCWETGEHYVSLDGPILAYIQAIQEAEMHWVSQPAPLSDTELGALSDAKPASMPVNKPDLHDGEPGLCLLCLSLKEHLQYYETLEGWWTQQWSKLTHKTYIWQGRPMDESLDSSQWCSFWAVKSRTFSGRSNANFMLMFSS